MSESVELPAPTPELLAEAAELKIWDLKGQQIRFGDLFHSQKTIVVFIRHFFCGMCQDFVAQLASISPESLQVANTKLVVIGCGQWPLIENYCKDSGYTGAMYADPSRDIYHKLGMTIETLAGTPSGEKPKSYVGSVLSVTLRSIWRGPVKNPHHAGKQGNISQLGGDLILGPGNTCSFAHLMRHTQDHIEVSELMQAAGVQFK